MVATTKTVAAATMSRMITVTKMMFFSTTSSSVYSIFTLTG